MKILVPLKRVIDSNVHVRLHADKSGIETDNVKMALNPFDEIALEEALKLKDSGYASQVVAISIGGEKCQEVLRQALALGVSQAILVKTDEDIQPFNVAQILAHFIKDLEIQLVLLGKQAIDGDNYQVGPMLAGLLDWGQAMSVSQLRPLKNGDSLGFQAQEETDEGLATVEIDLPVIISTELGLNTPRYVRLPQLLKARKMPIETIALETLSFKAHSKVTTVTLSAAPERSVCSFFKDADELSESIQKVVSTL